jgi:hypothetical protein
VSKVEKVRAKEGSGIKRASAFIQEARVPDGNLLSADDRAVETASPNFFLKNRVLHLTSKGRRPFRSSQPLVMFEKGSFKRAVDVNWRTRSQTLYGYEETSEIAYAALVRGPLGLCRRQFP